jgi:hypothetical protein
MRSEASIRLAVFADRVSAGRSGRQSCSAPFPLNGGTTMLEYQNKLVREVVACTCDRCHKRMTPDDNDFEWHERLSIAFRGGYGSISDAIT